ncbi:MAG: thiamine diphosphokinase [Clostridiales bacterium]|nr:thiamine diphosphokinase [Clostridiales bacterium]
MRYYVITGGPLTAEASKIIENGEVIAADGGIDFCVRYGIKPAFAVGDFDSVSSEGLEAIKKAGIPIKTYPVEKDMTDTELALSFIPEEADITVVCPLTGRLDHIIANLQICASLHENGRNIILDDGVTQVNFLAGKDSVTVDVSRWGADTSVSLVPMSKRITGVTTGNLYYPLSDAAIEFGKSLSFSNKPVENASNISVSTAEGLLAVITSKAV